MGAFAIIVRRSDRDRFRFAQGDFISDVAGWSLIEETAPHTFRLCRFSESAVPISIRKITREESNVRRNVLMKTIGAVRLWLGLSLFSVYALAQISPCDLNQDGTTNATDVQLAINMTVGAVPCTANIGGSGVCNAAIVQRVINAALGEDASPVQGPSRTWCR